MCWQLVGHVLWQNAATLPYLDSDVRGGGEAWVGIRFKLSTSTCDGAIETTSSRYLGVQARKEFACGGKHMFVQSFHTLVLFKLVLFFSPALCQDCAGRMIAARSPIPVSSLTPP